jgi:uncharacterized membrane protein
MGKNHKKHKKQDEEKQARKVVVSLFVAIVILGIVMMIGLSLA